MLTEKELKELVTLINETSVRLESLTQKLNSKSKLQKLLSWSADKSEMRHLSAKIRSKQIELQLKVRDYLVESNSSFKKLAEQNRQLLATDQFEILASTENYIFESGYSTKFTGKFIDSNHLIEYNSVQAETGYNNFSKHVYTKSFDGKIDFKGDSFLVATETSLTPITGSKFIGSITIDGIIRIRAVTSSLDLLGIERITRLIGDPFGSENEKRNNFILNKKEIERITSEFTAEIGA